MTEQIMKCADAIINAIPTAHLGDHPGLLCLFDGEIFVGISPIEDWHNPFEDALLGHTFDGAVVAVFATPPEDLPDLANECTFRSSDGAIHARPIRIFGITERAHTALPA